MKTGRVSVIVIFLLYSFIISAQQAVINELMPSNLAVISDEDGEYPDWIEFYNPQNSAINLSGYGISDDSGDLFKWVFPEIEIPPKDHLLIFASDKNRTTWVKHWETVIDQGDQWKYFVGTSEPSSQWKNPEFNDASWSSGPSGFGYGDGDDATIIPSTRSVYIRKVFNIESIDNVTAAILHVDYDDAFVAYLNGQEFARANIGTVNIPPPYNQSSNSAVEASIYLGGKPQGFTIDNLNILREGENVLAIQVHNYGSSSSDLTIIPFFSLGLNAIPQNPGVANPLLSLPNRYLHTNFKIDADGEKLFLTSPSGIIADSVSFGGMLPDISFGRQPDGTDSWFYFDEPTPEESNSTAAFTGIAPNPEFSLGGGLYTGTVTVSLSVIPSNAVIRYTLDGSVPGESSPPYSQPIQINSSRILRARAFSPGSIASNTITNSYLINVQTDLPVFSISTDPANFFDDEIGIYVMGDSAEPSYPYFGANFWKDWERPVHVEFFDINGESFSMDAGVKIFGAWSRGKAQKSLSVFARSRYGYSAIEYPLFPELPFTEYQSFVLRNSGNDWEYTMFRDGLMAELLDGIDIDKQDFRPAVLFLNGEYWGILNLREKVNEDFLAAHHNIDRENVEILENFGIIVTGDSTDYMELHNFIEDNDLTILSNYEYVKSKIEIDNFIRYYVSQIYFDNTDWPGNNVKFWREKNSGKWRWIVFDTDFGFGLYDDYGYMNNTLEFATAPNGPDWPNPPWSTLWLRKLLLNNSFRNDFINCAADLLNTNFLPINVINKINSIKNEIMTEIPAHINRWGAFSVDGWNYNVNRLITFANQRPSYYRSHLIQKFGLTGGAVVHITISDTSMGKVKLNSIEINTPDWSGSYFLNVPVRVIANPKRGFRFVHWDGSNTTSEDTITITITTTGVINLNAIFEEDPDFSDPRIVINEINYNSSESFDTQDWIELYNNDTFNVDISDWVFEDGGGNTYVIPGGTVLKADEYIVIYSDYSLFHPLFPDVLNCIGAFDFGLSGGGEQLKLVSSEGIIIDSLTYDDKSPWPDADGNGSTLSLINPDLENHLPQSWAASLGHGTPGKINDVHTDVKENEIIPEEFSLMQNYPNPFNPVTNIKYTVPKGSFVSLKLYDILGNEIVTLVNEYHQPGFYNLTFNAGSLSSGVYFYRIIAENFIDTKKLILLK